MALAPITRARLQSTGAFALALLLLWRVGGRILPVAATIAGALAALAWLAPTRYTPVQRALDRFTELVMAGLTWVVLGLVYFGLFTPVRLGRALLRRDPLRLRRDPAAASFLRPVVARTPSHFERQF